MTYQRVQIDMPRPIAFGLFVVLIAGCGAGEVTEEGSGPPDGGEPPDSGGTIDAGSDQPDAPPVIPHLAVCAQDADYSTIQAAIDAAQVDQVIEVCAGTYLESLVLDKAVQLVGLGGSGGTIIDAQGGGSAVLVTDVGALGPRLEGFTIQNGASASRGGGIRCSSSGLGLDDVVIRSSSASSGGALSASACDLEVTHSQFAGNQAAASGGGLYLVDSTGLVAESIIANNTAYRGGGLIQIEGAVAITGSDIHDNEALDIGGGMYQQSDGSITDTRIANNISGERGGGLTIVGHAPMTSNNVVTGNHSGDDGAGIYLYLSSATIADSEIRDNQSDGDAGGLRVLGSTATITGNQVRDNSAVGDGGGLKISHNKSVVRDNIFDGNRASGYGGGIELDDDWSTLSHLTITNNRAYRGGGLHCHENGASFRVEHTLIAHNTATRSGGAVRFDKVWTTGTFSFVTMTHNSSPEVGGADFASATEVLVPDKPIRKIRIDNSIIADNEGIQVRNEGGIIQGWSYTDVSPSNFAGMSDPAGASGNISASPAFVSPGDGNFHLQAASPCHDAGAPNLQDADGSRADMGIHGGPDAL